MIRNRRILVVDDQASIHDDFRKLLGAPPRSEGRADLAKAAADFLGEAALATDAAPLDDPDAAPSLTFEVSSAMQGEAGLEMVEKATVDGQPFAVAFVDVRMPPGWDGIETASRMMRSDPHLQVVICTAFSDFSWAQMVEKLPAADRLLVIKKPFDAIEVRQAALSLCSKWDAAAEARAGHDALREAHNHLQDEVRVRRLIEEKLRYRASHDVLTGLANRTLVIDRLTGLIEKMQAGQVVRSAVLFMDLDRFKLVNDTLGHSVGDQLLMTVGEDLRRRVREAAVEWGLPGDPLVGRLGGDEFVVVIEGLDEVSKARELGRALATHLSSRRLLGNQEVLVTASVGMAVLGPQYERAEQVLRDADTAMYTAKVAGPGQLADFAPQMHERVRRRLEMEAWLRAAVEQDEVQVAYQPVISLERGAVAGFEALARWEHPQWGCVMPCDFIPVAEECGLISALGEAIVTRACRDLAAWRRAFPDHDLTVSINLSRRQLVTRGFRDHLARVLEENALPASAVVVEPTEMAMSENPDHIRAALQGLREMGVRVYLDDFGTGYSSLSCLSQFPLDGLKIDQTFVHTMSSRRDFAAILYAIVNLAHNLGVRVVAEGVETAEQVAGLQAIETDFGQGFYFAEGLSPDEVPDFVTRARSTPGVFAPPADTLA